MKAQNLNQLQLSQATKIPANAISRYFSGMYQPPPNRLEAIANALEVSVEDLTIEEGTGKPSAVKQICFCPYCGENIREIAN